MQRSVLSSPSSSGPRGRAARRLGAVAISSALLLTLGAGAAQATDGRDRGSFGTQWQKKTPSGRSTPTPTPKPSATQKPQTTGAYVYVKLDATKPADWPNSTQQYLVTTWPGASWRDLTLEEVLAAVPAELEVCGDAWGVQQDQAWGDATVFTQNEAPFYPHDVIGWVQNGGPIFAADHWDLTEMVTVPECGTATPAPTPTVTLPPTSEPSPSVPTVPVPTVPVPTVPEPTVPVETPTPTLPPTEVVGDAPTPTPSVTPPVTPSPTPTVVVVAAPSASPTPTATFYSEVLAAPGDGGAVLAATGSSTVPGVLAGAVLVLAGAALLLLRRRRTS